MTQEYSVGDKVTLWSGSGAGQSGKIIGKRPTYQREQVEYLYMVEIPGYDTVMVFEEEITLGRGRRKKR